ncbi:MAG TPA: FAD-binding oxidoreductase [Victivallales bacterium]|nr:FAD-binding oxidoreductase [Victivallales bacterium]
MKTFQSENYNPVTSDIVNELKNIIGSKYVIFDDSEKLEPFSHDETPDRKYAHMPEAVVRPSTASEISEIVKLANKHMIPITPRGAGSGLSGGAVPIYGGIVISIDRMNKVIELDKDNMMITVEPGVIANDINEYLEGTDLFYAGYPMSYETCYISGNVAENAGGGKAVKYGVTSRYVLGLEVVTPKGEIVEYGGKLVKDVSGYSMVQFMVGSEGTLGIFTKIILKLIPAVKYKIDILCLFDTVDNAIETVNTISSATGVVPSAIEFMDKQSIQASCEYLNETIPYEEAGAMLIVTVDGKTETEVDSDYTAICELFEKHEGVIEIYVADNPTTSERIWKVRRNIAEAFNLISQRQSNEDIVVPPASIAVMTKKLNTLADKYGIRIPCFGHAGDGNIHARIMSPEEWSNERWNEVIPKILEELYDLTSKLGGKISGEHGIGHKRKHYLERVTSKEYMDIIKSIKIALDPNCILNPGKIFDI